MKNSFIVLLMFTFLSCGEEALLKDGKYKVIMTYLKSDWGVPENTESYIIWEIEKQDKNYTIKVPHATYSLIGTELNEQIYFTHVQEISKREDCRTENTLKLVIMPQSSQESFHGTGSSELSVCTTNGKKLVKELYSFYGEHK